MVSVPLLGLLLGAATAIRQNHNGVFVSRDVLPTCPSSIFSFCSANDLAGGGVACVASAEATVDRDSLVQCVPKKNNKDSTYSCPAHLSVMCDPFQTTVIPLMPPDSDLIPNNFLVQPETVELPIYCGLSQMAMNKIAYQPITKDLTVEVTIPFKTGAYTMVINAFELGSISIEACDTNVALADDVLSISASAVKIEVLSLGWTVRRNWWPHFNQSGALAKGSIGASFNISLDLKNDQENGFDLRLDEINIDLGGYKHEWFYAALGKLIHAARPIISPILQHVAKSEIHTALDIVRTQGGCTLLQDGLHSLAAVELSFATEQPIATHVPIIGLVSTIVKSTSIELPQSMSCVRASFNGTSLTFHIHDFAFGASFDWSYRKGESTFWQNNGKGSVHATVGLSLHIDLERPDATTVDVQLPELDIKLGSEHDKWVYKMLPDVVSPFVKAAVNHLGGYLAKVEIKRVLRNKFQPVYH